MRARVIHIFLDSIRLRVLGLVAAYRPRIAADRKLVFLEVTAESLLVANSLLPPEPEPWLI